MDFDIYSPIGDDRPLIRIADRTGMKLALRDVALSMLWLVVGSSPALALFVFMTWR